MKMVIIALILSVAMSTIGGCMCRSHERTYSNRDTRAFLLVGNLHELYYVAHGKWLQSSDEMAEAYGDRLYFTYWTHEGKHKSLLTAEDFQIKQISTNPDTFEIVTFGRRWDPVREPSIYGTVAEIEEALQRLQN